MLWQFLLSVTTPPPSSFQEIRTPPSDMWTQDDDILFLKYCPSKRDKCYHAISRDSSCRPQLLKLRIKDVVFKMVGRLKYKVTMIAYM